MRAVLEGITACLAARAASEIELDELEALNAEIATALEGKAADELNRQFQLTLLDAAKNRYLIKSVNALHMTLLIIRNSTLFGTTRTDDAVAEHTAVLQASRPRDGRKAETLMRAHIEQAHRVRLRTLRQKVRPTASTRSRNWPS